MIVLHFHSFQSSWLFPVLTWLQSYPPPCGAFYRSFLAVNTHLAVQLARTSPFPPATPDNSFVRISRTIANAGTHARQFSRPALRKRTVTEHPPPAAVILESPSVVSGLPRIPWLALILLSYPRSNPPILADFAKPNYYSAGTNVHSSCLFSDTSSLYARYLDTLPA